MSGLTVKLSCDKVSVENGTATLSGVHPENLGCLVGDIPADLLYACSERGGAPVDLLMDVLRALDQMFIIVGIDSIFGPEFRRKLRDTLMPYLPEEQAKELSRLLGNIPDRVAGGAS